MNMIDYGLNIDKDSTRRLILQHYERYPKMQIEDMFKLLFHSSFGCEHAVSSLERVRGYMLSELERADMDSDVLVEELDSDYSRVHLSYISRGLSPDTLAVMFYLSARPVEDGRERLKFKLSVLRDMAREGRFAFSLEALDAAISEWESLGYPAIHHSATFRECYNPAYRVVLSRYAELIPALIEIDKASREGREVDLDTLSLTDAERECVEEIYRAR